MRLAPELKVQVQVDCCALNALNSAWNLDLSRMLWGCALNGPYQGPEASAATETC